MNTVNILSDHFNGRRFFNPAVPAGRRLRDLLRWGLTRRRTRWPRRVEGSIRTGPWPTPKPGEVAATFVNQSTFLLQFSTANVLTDPMWSERASPVSWAGPRRVRPPGVRFEDLPDIHVVLVSHNHYDHMDLPTLRRLQKRFHPLFLTTLGNRRYLMRRGLTRVEELDWWQAQEATRLELTLTPAQHFSARGLFDRNRTLWGGFLLRSGSLRVYFVGDSGYGEHFKEIRRRLGPIDLALLPFAAYEPRWFMQPAHMNPAEAVQAHLDLDPALTLGMHYGTFQLTDEALGEPERALQESLAAHIVDPACFRVPSFGETISIPAAPQTPPADDGTSVISRSSPGL
jgi:L-ascorbate metabolism protein UlaG (beta-lactamase superfamily)